MREINSSAHWILLAISYAADANIAALRSISSAKPRLLRLELVLRILLTYLPESLEPDTYVGFLQELDGQHVSSKDQAIQVDWRSVGELSNGEAQERLKKTRLKRLRPRGIRSPGDVVVESAPDDPITLFVIQRSHAIEKETGLLTLVPGLVRPFLKRSAYLKVWFVSTILALLRFENGSQEHNDTAMDLETFETFEGAAGVNILMSRSALASRERTISTEDVSRDLRGSLGPWTFGSTQRKRRKLDTSQTNTPTPLVTKGSERRTMSQYEQEDGELKAQNKPQLEPADQLEDWQHTFRWMLTTAVDNFDLSVKTVDGWRGPGDVDLGDVDMDEISAHDDETQSQLHIRYCQAALACLYATDADGYGAVGGAQTVIERVADLMQYPRPPDLDAELSSIPTITQQIGEPARPLDSYSPAVFRFDQLLSNEQPLTMPTMEALTLSSMLVRSTHVLTQLGFNMSFTQVAKLRLYGDEADAILLVQKILHQQTTKSLNGKDWLDIRQQLLWLRDWNIDQPDSSSDDASRGIFAKLPRMTLEREVLRMMGNTGQLSLIRDVYLSTESPGPLHKEDVERTLIALFDEFYAGATNGNKTRGSMKKANDLLTTFQPSFPGSDAFRTASALLTATHALSFYALTLEPGQPTAPITIKESRDPLGLIGTVLSENSGSYTNLEDLIAIARNLVIANSDAFSNSAASPYSTSGVDLAKDEKARIAHARQMTTAMAIDAALNENDFETAYSYVVNRMSLHAHASRSEYKAAAISGLTNTDDTSWRAAYEAGRHPTTLPANAPLHNRTRRLEQRMDLLSRALDLAPHQTLPEILAAWRRCEEELLALLQHQADAEAEADELAEKRLSGARGSSDLPGTFRADQPALIQGQQRRKEIGRASRADGEAPMGLFDVARGAAQAFGRMGQGGKQQPSTTAAKPHFEEADTEVLDGGERLRKRDMVANAVTGGMAKGIGWVLGANPVTEQSRD